MALSPIAANEMVALLAVEEVPLAVRAHYSSLIAPVDEVLAVAAVEVARAKWVGMDHTRHHLGPGWIRMEAEDAQMDWSLTAWARSVVQQAWQSSAVYVSSSWLGP